VVNAALNTLRREKKHTPLDAETEPVVLESLLARASGVEDQVELLQIKQQLRAALLALPPRQRTAIIQRYYLGMDEKEMAAELDAAPGTVKWLLNVARARLRELLGAERTVG
jgi:RNA polymerase sigma-70 factor (ECF subfamily)